MLQHCFPTLATIIDSNKLPKMTISCIKSQSDEDSTPSGSRSRILGEMMRKACRSLAKNVLIAPPGYKKMSKAERPRNMDESNARPRSSGYRVERDPGHLPRKSGKGKSGDKRPLLESESEPESEPEPEQEYDSRASMDTVSEEIVDGSYFGTLSPINNGSRKPASSNRPGTHGETIPDENPFADSFESMYCDDLESNSTSEHIKGNTSMGSLYTYHTTPSP